LVLLATILVSALRAGVVLVFPAGAVWVARRRGLGALAGLAVGSWVAVLALAFLMSSVRFGNRLSATYGYGHIVSTTLLAFTFWAIVPMLVAALVAAAFAKRSTPVVVAGALAIGASALAWLLGIGVALWLAWGAR
jgi:hypothetical protein